MRRRIIAGREIVIPEEVLNILSEVLGASLLDEVLLLQHRSLTETKPAGTVTLQLKRCKKSWRH